MGPKPFFKKDDAFVGDLFEQLVERVAADRGLAAEKVRELVDIGVFTPEASNHELVAAITGATENAVSRRRARKAAEQGEISA